MKLFKGILVLMMLTIFILPVNASSGKYLDAGSLSSLNRQLSVEVNDIMQLPAYIVYQGKDLKGEAFVKILVNENGKIDIIEIDGNNRHLNSLITKKFNTLNLWTHTKYTGSVFVYNIKMI